MTKVYLLYKDPDGHVRLESVNASKNDGYYSIENAPFFAESIAYGDLVEVESEDGKLFVTQVVWESDNSTLQIVLFKLDRKDQVTHELLKLGCDWEGSHSTRLSSVNIPKNVDYSQVPNYMNMLLESGVCDFKEACLSDKHASDIGE